MEFVKMNSQKYYDSGFIKAVVDGYKAGKKVRELARELHVPDSEINSILEAQKVPFRRRPPKEQSKPAEPLKELKTIEVKEPQPEEPRAEVPKVEVQKPGVPKPEPQKAPLYVPEKPKMEFCPRCEGMTESYQVSGNPNVFCKKCTCIRIPGAKPLDHTYDGLGDDEVHPMPPKPEKWLGR